MFLSSENVMQDLRAGQVVTTTVSSLPFRIEASEHTGTVSTFKRLRFLTHSPAEKGSNPRKEDFPC